MGAAEEYVAADVEEQGPQERVEGLDLAPSTVEVYRNGVVGGVVGVASAVVAIVYLARATQTGGLLDWAFAVGLGLLAAGWLSSLVDSRTPLLVADTQGVRVRLGRGWHGLPWGAVREVEHRPRRGLSDGRLVVVPHNEERFTAELDAAGRRQVALSRRLHGAPLAIPLGLTTRVEGADGDLYAALSAVADGASRVVVVEDEVAAGNDGAEPYELEDETAEAFGAEAPLDEDALDDDVEVTPAAGDRLRDGLALLGARVSSLFARGDEESLATTSDELDVHDDHEDVETTQQWDAAELAEAVEPAPSPVRDLRSARRSEVTVVIDDLADDEIVGRELRRAGSVDLVEETQAWGDRVRPISRQGDPVEALVIDEFAVQPAEDPVIGPEISAARTRLGLSVDQLADRTRIRPHVIESIEVDDFAPCGGDFYARGHLRTLARVLGIDVAPLLSSYDDRYANAPVNPRRVFEAELATGVNGSIRGTRGGPNWSVLVAAVMALVLCWSIARLVMDNPTDLRSDLPVLNGSGGPDGSSGAALADPVKVVLSTPAGGAHLVVRDASGEIVFKGSLTAGATKELKASPPVRVQSSDGAATVALDGQKARPVGEAGVAGQSTYVVG
ncbi:MAG: helix-turn-helix domain-containing protein [Nocardioides sp.]|uniref:helix-turn-helix domain-containing protein n=1 Tax=Nocardioides sp. TaxID=35761 RepID=UPI003EFD112B